MWESPSSSVLSEELLLDPLLSSLLDSGWIVGESYPMRALFGWDLEEDESPLRSTPLVVIEAEGGFTLGGTIGEAELPTPAGAIPSPLPLAPHG